METSVPQHNEHIAEALPNAEFPRSDSKEEPLGTEAAPSQLKQAAGISSGTVAIHAAYLEAHKDS